LESLYARLIRELEDTPGVDAAAATSRLPLEGVTWADGFLPEGDVSPRTEWPVGYFHLVTTEYFSTLGIPLRSGAAFTEAQRGNAVVVMSQRAASLAWPDENPVGRNLRLGSNMVARVVGVTADVTASGLEAEREPIIYVPPWTQFGFPATAAVAVRSSALPPAQLAPHVRTALRAAVPGIVISEERTMEQVVADAAASRRFQLTLLLVFAVTALVTAAVGIYGVIAHSLTQRRGEIGVRMALGANRGMIHRLILGEGMRATAAGLAAGLLVAIASGGILQSLLYGVRPADPLVLGAIALLLGSVAALAAYVPARRASGADPSASLRQD